ncbi:MAG TPA: carbohydrate-binding protein [Firmicutes bacterium]|nr:carbohydrate-binding protein [Bacillota bacterium]
MTGAARRGTRTEPGAEYRGDDGVYVRPTPITAGSEVTVKYDGLLARSGADQVYLHMGFGPNDSWRDTRDIPMTKTTDNMWTTVVPISIDETSRFNFCFRDSANNWDNNNGANWSYEIHNGENPVV